MPELFNYSYRLLNLNQAGTLTDFEYPIEGQKLIYMAPTDGPALSIKLQAKSNDGIPLRPQGQIIAPFQRLYISGVIGAELPVLIVASPASLSIESRDVNVNAIATLSTIINPIIAKDFVLDRAIALGQIFERYNLFSTITNNAHLQVFNPIGSNKTVVVLALQAWNNSLGGPYTIRRHNTALGTLIGNLFNTQSGAPNSLAQLRSADSALVGTEICQFHQSTIPTYPMHSRYDVLDPGEGLLVANTIGANLINAWFRIFEF